jgi:hypothetical protein
LENLYNDFPLVYKNHYWPELRVYYLVTLGYHLSQLYNLNAFEVPGERKDGTKK